MDEGISPALQALVVGARTGTLPAPNLIGFLAQLVAAEKWDVAAMIYDGWARAIPAGLRLTAEESEALARLREQIAGAVPGGADLAAAPAAVAWMRMDIDGEVVEFVNITDPVFMDFFERARPHSLSMHASPEPALSLYKTMEYIVKHRIPGDIVECGVWNGGSVLLMALALRHFGDTSRKIYLYDTFDGMARPEEVDRNYWGVSTLATWEQHRQNNPDAPNWGFGGTVEMVREVVLSSGYPPENFVFVKGMVEDTLPVSKPDTIAFLHLDTDFYSSTYAEFTHLYPALSIGGVVNVDDYGLYQGAKLATDQYLEENRLPLLLHRIGAVCVGVKLELPGG